MNCGYSFDFRDGRGREGVEWGWGGGEGGEGEVVHARHPPNALPCVIWVDIKSAKPLTWQGQCTAEVTIAFLGLSRVRPGCYVSPGDGGEGGGQGLRDGGQEVEDSGGERGFERFF